MISLTDCLSLVNWAAVGFYLMSTAAVFNPEHICGHAMANHLGYTVGVLLICSILTAIGFGVTSMQTYLWYRHYPRDARHIRIVVWSVTCLDITHIVLAIHMCYYYLVLNYYNPEALTKAVWSFGVSVVVTAAITLIVHSFYAWRIYVLSHGNKILPQIIIFFAWIRLIFGIWTTAKMARVVDLSRLPKAIAPLVGTGMGAGSLCDCIITVSLVYYLKRSRNGFNIRTDSVLDQLAYWTVNCGALTSVVGLAVIFTFIAMPDSMVYIALHLLLSKLYANALLATLNFRKAHSGRGINDEETALSLSTFRANRDESSLPYSKSDKGAVIHVMTSTTTDTPDDGNSKQPIESHFSFANSSADERPVMDDFKNS